jgi:hypothetical protein
VYALPWDRGHDCAVGGAREEKEKRTAKRSYQLTQNLKLLHTNGTFETVQDVLNSVQKHTRTQTTTFSTDQLSVQKDYDLCLPVM